MDLDAPAIGCDAAQIVKSLVFTAVGRPVIARVIGASRLDPTDGDAASAVTISADIGYAGRNTGSYPVR